MTDTKKRVRIELRQHVEEVDKLKEEIHGLKVDLATALHEKQQIGFERDSATALGAGYRRDVIAWRDKYDDAQVSLEAANRRVVSSRTWIAVVSIGLFILGALIVWAKEDKYNSTTEAPPAFVKMDVVVKGYIDDKGIYRSYEDGLPLKPQPTAWRLR